MVGGEREGSGKGNVHANANATATIATFGGAQPPATAPLAAANGGRGNGSHANAGKGGGSGGGLVVEKVKFTVSVRGHQWSSARHVNEKLEEFAAAIERNARRLAFIDNDDSIQRLQLTYSDGSEPEDLDVDATLADVIICMGDKQLLAIVNSTQPTPPPPVSSNGTPTQRPGSESSPQINNAIARNCNVSVAAPSSSPDLVAPSAAPKFPCPDYTPPCRSALTNDAGASKLITPPESAYARTVKRECSFHPDSVAGAGASLPPLPRPSGKLNTGGAGKSASGPSAVQQQFCNPTPSPAELANMLVRSLSSSQRMQGPGVIGVAGATGVSASTSTRSPASRAPTAGFQSFASTLLSRLLEQNIHCPQGATTNIVLLAQLLAQFLASQVRASSTPDAALPTPASCGDHMAPKVTDPVTIAVVNPLANASPACNLQAEKENRPDPGVQAINLGSPNHPDGANNAKQSVSGATSHGNSKEKSSSSSDSSAHVHNSFASQSGDGEGVNSELPNGGSELVFLVKRRSKTGVGPHELRMSDLSVYFHLSLVNAANKIGVSQTTLKKACRKFGLKRWPGRKVRSLESTIHGLKHLGQGAGLKELNEVYMQSEVCKLQQEMDQLVHGTPAQVAQKMHSTTARTAELYKRLYSRGWRSKYHSAGRQDTIPLDAGKRASGLAPPTSRRKYIRKAPKDNQPRRKAIALSKEDPVVTPPQPAPTSCKKHPRDTVMKDCDVDGLLAENGNHSGTPKTTSGEKEKGVVFAEGSTIAQRSFKRPKRRIAAEGGVVS